MKFVLIQLSSRTNHFYLSVLPSNLKFVTINFYSDCLPLVLYIFVDELSFSSVMFLGVLLWINSEILQQIMF